MKNTAFISFVWNIYQAVSRLPIIVHSDTWKQASHNYTQRFSGPIGVNHINKLIKEIHVSFVSIIILATLWVERSTWYIKQKSQCRQWSIGSFESIKERNTLICLWTTNSVPKNSLGAKGHPNAIIHDDNEVQGFLLPLEFWSKKPMVKSVLYLLPVIRMWSSYFNSPSFNLREI